MKTKAVLAAIAVKDIEKAITWYERLFGRTFDDRPMREAAEWRLSTGGGVQLVLDEGRAGKSMATLGVVAIDEVVSELASRGIETKATAPGDAPFRLAQLTDPDGNMLTFAEDQRETGAR